MEAIAEQALPCNTELASVIPFQQMTNCSIIICTLMLLQGHYVDHIIGQGSIPASNFTYWLPPPPPPYAPGQEPPPSRAPPRPLKAPTFYEPAPPAPPGLIWWHFKDDVPPLPEPKKYFHNDSVSEKCGRQVLQMP